MGYYSDKVTSYRGMTCNSLSSEKEKKDCANIIARSSILKIRLDLALKLDQVCQILVKSEQRKMLVILVARKFYPWEQQLSTHIFYHSLQVWHANSCKEPSCEA